MRMALGIAALLVAHGVAEARSERTEPGPPGSTAATLGISWSRFERFYDADGRATTLDDAFGPDAEGVAVDAILFRFGGEYVLGPGLEAHVDVPLVRVARSGSVDTILGKESLYAESLALGDVSAGARFEIPLELGGIGPAFGVAGALKAPTGNHERVDEEALPTGGGDWGIGGELFVVARPWHAELGASASLLLLLPHERDGFAVDRGDARVAKVWAAFPLGSRVKAGVTVLALQREADRVEGEPVESLAGGAQPGVLVPESRLLSAAPYVEITPSRRARVLVSLGAPATPWLFVPGETGWAISGKNVLLPQTQVGVSFVTDF